MQNQTVVGRLPSVCPVRAESFPGHRRTRRPLLVSFAVTVLSALALLATTQDAEAALINNGWYTTDTESGLEWADLYLADGLSYQAVLSGAGHSLFAPTGWYNEGWRHATHTEVIDFWETIGGIEIEQSGTVSVPLQTLVQSYVGRTQWSGGLTSRAWSYGMIADDFNPFYTYYMGLYRRSSFLGSTTHRAYGVDPMLNINRFANWNHGHWLVRDTSPTAVREPATLSLMLPGLLALGWRRRARR